MALEIQDYLIQQRKKNIKVFEREGRDLHDDSAKSARDLGQARLDHSRLNLFTSLGPGDKEDNFKFKVPTPGPLRLGLWPTDGTRIQLMDGRGKLLADSEGTGKVLEKYENIIKSKERIDVGEYFIRVTRSGTSDTSKEIPYSLQVQVGSINREDYDTTEYVADPKKKDEVYDPNSQARPTAAARQSEMIATMIGNGLNNFNNLITRTTGIFGTIMNRLFGG
ncbi:MAG: hypothetical protein ISR46_06050 [Rhodospirillales bacterium]|nr:hypothetical protein [Rhodospirillales bacterium]